MAEEEGIATLLETFRAQVAQVVSLKTELVRAAGKRVVLQGASPSLFSFRQEARAALRLCAVIGLLRGDDDLYA